MSSKNTFQFKQKSKSKLSTSKNNSKNDNEPPKPIQPTPSVVFEYKSGEYGSERALRGVPQNMNIQLNMTKEDCVDTPLSNPAQVKERMEKYKKAIDDVMQWTDKEKEMLAMTLRDH